MAKAIQAIRRGETLVTYYYIVSLQVLVILRVACDQEGHIRATRFGVRTPPESQRPPHTEELPNEEAFYRRLITKGLRPPTTIGNMVIGAIFSVGHIAASKSRKFLQTEQRFSDYGTTVWAIYSTHSKPLDVVPSRQFLIEQQLMSEDDAYAVLQRYPCEQLDPSYYVLSS